MKRQLRLAARISPQMDTVIIISIKEGDFKLPPKTHPLLSRPDLSCSVFKTVGTRSLGVPVVIENINWLQVKRVTFHVALWRPDGEFEFEEKGPLYAEGVSLFIIL